MLAYSPQLLVVEVGRSNSGCTVNVLVLIIGVGELGGCVHVFSLVQNTGGI